jgi:high-affinity iron transporter
VSLMATVATWFVVVGVLATLDATLNIPALKIQAATGLLAIGVLLVIMNWFFHKVYWTGWITMHNRRKRNLLEDPQQTRRRVFQGLALIGFTSVYREGFEIVLFLQSYRLKFGTATVMQGVLIGLFLTSLVAMLTFVAHQRLPYKKMLVMTGIMLGAVLVVMVGENIQEMQQAHWMTQHDLSVQFPDWLGTWFAIFNNWETIGAQALAAGFVIGSYYLARRVCRTPAMAAEQQCIVPDCDNCELKRAD